MVKKIRRYGNSPASSSSSLIASNDETLIQFVSCIKFTYATRNKKRFALLNILAEDLHNFAFNLCKCFEKTPSIWG